MYAGWANCTAVQQNNLQKHKAIFKKGISKLKQEITETETQNYDRQGSQFLTAISYVQQDSCESHLLIFILV